MIIAEVIGMLCKRCPECGRSSYSASDRGSWICPYCGEDLRERPACPARPSEPEGRPGLGGLQGTIPV